MKFHPKASKEDVDEKHKFSANYAGYFGIISTYTIFSY